MKTNEQRKQQMDNWVAVGFAKERDELTRKVFKQSIGTNGVHRWRPSPGLLLTAMEMAILDTMYDAGEGAEFKPKDLVNDHTRMAYMIDKDWALYFVADRKQESCGHDERDCFVYQIYEHYKDEDCYSGWNRRVIKEWYTDEDDCPTLEEFEKLAEEQYEKEKNYRDKRDSRLIYSHHSCHNIDTYKGECAWDDRKCKHHHSVLLAPALVRLVDKDTKAEKQYLRKSKWGRSEYANQFDYRFLDEEDHEALLCDVNDSDVLAHIRATIPKMKTEARDWLYSTTQVWDIETKSYMTEGMRGVYRLGWWGIDSRVRETEIITAEYNELNGTEVNGWVFKKQNDAHGFWGADIKLWKVASLYNRRNQFAMDFLYKAEAETAAQQMNSMPRLTHSYDAEGAPSNIVRVEESTKELHLHNNLVSLCEKYTPHEYFVACHNGEVANESNKVCQHEEEDE